MKKDWKVEIRKQCKICNKSLPKRFRTFCSTHCRQKSNNIKNSQYQIAWAKKKRGQYQDNKLQCGICESWYVQVISHVIQEHQMTNKEYREYMNLPLSNGVVPHWYSKEKGETAISNKTYLNLKKGIKTRYVKGDIRAKQITGWKGRTGSRGFTHNKYY